MEHYEIIKDRLLYILTRCLFVGVILFLPWKLVIAPEIGFYKAKNPKNIKTACLYRIKDVWRKQGITKKIFKVNGRTYDTESGSVPFSYINPSKKFPFAKKNKYIDYGKSIFWDEIATEKDKCYLVKYIKVYDLFFMDKIYLYDFEIPKDYQPKNHQPIKIETQH